MAEVGLGDSDGVTSVVDDGTFAAGVREGDEEEEEMIDGDSLEGLSSIILSRLGS